jgi:hypothetical protein
MTKKRLIIIAVILIVLLSAVIYMEDKPGLVLYALTGIELLVIVFGIVFFFYVMIPPCIRVIRKYLLK